MPHTLPLPQNKDLPKIVADRLDALPPINVYRMIANAPQCLVPWTDMVKALYESKVDIRLREIAILRQASRAKSPYELHQHKFIAAANGLTEAEINFICQTTGPATPLNDRENAVCQMADELESQATLTDQTLGKLQEYFDNTELTELIILTSFYCCVARVLNATRVEIEENDPLKGVDSPN